MDKAIINKKVVSAYEISLDYELENKTRECSRNKQIRCVDSNCGKPVLKYCHGNKKVAYFAHLSNVECDYDKFDKNDNSVFRELRIKLFNIFKNLGYAVSTEHKLLKHHYSPLYCTKDDESFVIEMGDSKKTKNSVEKLQNEYAEKQISVKWIVVGEEVPIARESDVSHIERFLLNETKNNNLILIDGYKIIQYRLDKKKYKLPTSPEVYNESADIEKLCIENGELSIDGFDSRFEAWQQSKENDLESKLKKAEEQKKRYTELTAKPKEESKKIYMCTECGLQSTEEEFYSMQGDTGICWSCLYGPEKWEHIKKCRGIKC